jgi:MFS family permease
MDRLESKPQRLPFQIYALGAVSFLMDVASEMVYPLLPLFLVGSLGVGKEIVGLIEGIAEATANLSKVVSGRLSDRAATRKPFLLAGYGLPFFARPLLALATSPWYVLSFRSLDRLGKGIRTAPRDALIAENASKEMYGRAYGLHRAMDSFGATLGPLIAVLLLPSLGFHTIFWLSMIPAALCVVVILTIVKEKPVEPKPLLPFHFKNYSPVYLRFLLVSGVFTLALSSNAFLLLKLIEVGFSDTQSAFIYALYNLSYALIAYPLGALADAIGRKRLVAWSLTLYGLVYLGFGFASQAWLVVVLFFIYGVYSAGFEGSSRAYLAELIPSEEKASAIGLYHTVNGLLLLPASFIFGWLWQNVSARAAFLTSASLALLAALLFIVLLRQKDTT